RRHRLSRSWASGGGRCARRRPRTTACGRERLAEARSLPLDADPLEDLDPPTIAIDHLEVDANGVPCLELGEVRAHVTLLEALDRRVHREKGAGGPARNPSGTRAAGAAR